MIFRGGWWMVGYAACWRHPSDETACYQKPPSSPLRNKSSWTLRFPSTKTRTTRRLRLWRGNWCNAHATYEPRQRPCLDASKRQSYPCHQARLRYRGKILRYPYGTIPRLLLFWMNTEAVKTKSRRLELGHNLSDFIRAVGPDPNTGGGVRSDARRLRNQMERLFRTIISFQVDIEEPHRHGGTALARQKLA